MKNVRVDEAASLDRHVYRSPPVVERAISVAGEIDAVRYETRIEQWREIVSAEFPEYDPVPQWTLNLKQENGVPLFDSSPPEVHILHRYWRKSRGGKRAWCIQIRPNLISVNLLREPHDSHRFEEIAAVLAEWLPRWQQHFEVVPIRGVTIEYVNVISHETTPQFATPRAVDISKAFALFSSVPIPNYGLKPPYNCEITLICDKDMPCDLNIHVAGLTKEESKHPAVQIRFRASTAAASKKLTVTSAIAEVFFAHSKIIDAFERLFTSDARQSFDAR